MPEHITIGCIACGEELVVDDDQEETRCGTCGTKFSEPWGDPEVIRSPIPEHEWGGESGEGTVTFEIELPLVHVDALTEGGRAPQESIHRAIRLYREMENPDELIAEDDLRRAA